MTIDKSKILRKFVSLAVCILLYFIIHEGAHLIFALSWGVFVKIKISLLGVQIVMDVNLLTPLQLGLINAAGVSATLFAAVLLVIFTNNIVKLKSKLLRAMFYYLTFVMLLTDPLYLSVISGFVGGGDVNGFVQGFGMSEVLTRVIFGGIFIVNLLIFILFVYPKYKISFIDNKEKKTT